MQKTRNSTCLLSRPLRLSVFKCLPLGKSFIAHPALRGRPCRSRQCSHAARTRSPCSVICGAFIFSAARAMVRYARSDSTVTIASPSQWRSQGAARTVIRAQRRQTEFGQTTALMRALAFIATTNHDEPRRALLRPVAAPILDQDPSLRFRLAHADHSQHSLGRP